MYLPPKLQDWKADGTLNSRRVQVVKDRKVPKGEIGVPLESVYYANLEEAAKHENLEDFAGPFGNGEEIRFESWKAYDICSR